MVAKGKNKTMDERMKKRKEARMNELQNKRKKIKIESLAWLDKTF